MPLSLLLPDHLHPGGWLLFEVGIGQADAVRELFMKTGHFGELFTAKDPGGIERVVGGQIDVGARHAGLPSKGAHASPRNVDKEVYIG